MADTRKKRPILPGISEEELESGSFCEELFSENFVLDDPAGEGIAIIGDNVDGTCGRGAEFRDCFFKKCSFQGIRWKNAAFQNCVFVDCDLSNAHLSEAFLRRCRFVGCKMVGCDLSYAIFRDVTFEKSVMRFLNLSFGKWNGVCFTECDLSESSVMALQENRGLILEESTLRRTEFTETSLKDVDLTTNEIGGLLVSGARELKGAIVTEIQAIQLASLLGVIVR